MNYTAVARGRHDTPCVRDALRATCALDGGCLVACALHQRSVTASHPSCVLRRESAQHSPHARARVCRPRRRGRLHRPREMTACKTCSKRTMHDAFCTMHAARMTKHAAPTFGTSAEYTDTSERTAAAAALAWQRSVAPHRTGRLCAASRRTAAHATPRHATPRHATPNSSSYQAR